MFSAFQRVMNASNGTIVSLDGQVPLSRELLLPSWKKTFKTSKPLSLPIDSTSNINGYLPVISTTVSFYLTWKGHLYCQAQLTCLTLTQKRKVTERPHLALYLGCILKEIVVQIPNVFSKRKNNLQDVSNTFLISMSYCSIHSFTLRHQKTTRLIYGVHPWEIFQFIINIST